MRIAAVLIFALMVVHGAAAAQSESTEIAIALPPEPSDYVTLISPYSDFEAIRKGGAQPTTQSFSLSLIPKWFDLKAFYVEKRQPITPSAYSDLEANSAPSNL